MDGNIWPPSNWKSNNEFSNRAPTGQLSSQSSPNWSKMLEANCHPNETSVSVAEEPNQTESLQAQPEKEMHRKGTCDTDTDSRVNEAEPNWSELLT